MPSISRKIQSVEQVRMTLFGFEEEHGRIETHEMQEGK
jgi:hypothetical protein